MSLREDDSLSMRVLLVEDDFVIRELVAEILSHRGHEVSTCSDAESAWQLCQEAPLLAVRHGLGAPRDGRSGADPSNAAAR